MFEIILALFSYKRSELSTFLQIFSKIYPLATSEKLNIFIEYSLHF
ncbi:hypothetical protein X874_12530 [Mannheimia varigena USDA-ARS-USMARC-1312]|nr:hypothetical protein X874_12530 [Mannheimia varigena USDA-ARS-USMARC-1312]